jgi:hypothetical protein
MSEFISAHTGLVYGGFFLLAAVLLLWTLVIAPRRSKQLLERLEKYGYAIIDPKNPEIAAGLQELGPYSLEGPMQPHLQELQRKVISAAANGAGKRFLVNVSQMHETDIPSDTGSVYRATTTIWQSFILEKRILPFSHEVYIRPRCFDTSQSVGRHARFGLREISVGDADFLRDFCISTRDGVSVEVPASLRRTLSSMAYSLIEPKGLKTVFRDDLLRKVNIKLCSEGWGICASDVYLRPKSLETLIKVAQSISESL